MSYEWEFSATDTPRWFSKVFVSMTCFMSISLSMVYEGVEAVKKRDKTSTIGLLCYPSKNIPNLLGSLLLKLATPILAFCCVA